MCRRCAEGSKQYEDIPAEEIADIALVGDEFPPGTYMSFTPTFNNPDAWRDRDLE